MQMVEATIAQTLAEISQLSCASVRFPRFERERSYAVGRPTDTVGVAYIASTRATSAVSMAANAAMGTRCI